MLFPPLLIAAFITLTFAQGHGSPYVPPSIITAPEIPNQTPDPLSPSPLAPVEFNPDNVSWAPWASPTAPESSPGDIFICTAASFTGTCLYIHSVTYQCNNLLPPYAGALTSIRPDKGQLCLFYDLEDCFGQSEWLRWPGTENLRGRGWHNRVRSWRCMGDSCEGAQGPGGCRENPDGSPKGLLGDKSG